MLADPWEQNDLLRSTDPDVIEAREKLEAVAATFPNVDGWPRYNDNPPQPWDRKLGKARSKESKNTKP